MDLRSAVLAVAAVGLSGVVVAATTAGARGAFVDVAPIDLRRGEVPAPVVELGPPPAAEPTAPPAEGAPPVDGRDDARVDTGGSNEEPSRSDDRSEGSDAPAQGSTAGPVRRAPAPPPKPAPQPVAPAGEDEDDDDGNAGGGGGGGGGRPAGDGQPRDSDDQPDRAEDDDKDDGPDSDDDPDADKDSDDADADDRDDVLDD